MQFYKNPLRHVFVLNRHNYFIYLKDVYVERGFTQNVEAIKLIAVCVQKTKITNFVVSVEQQDFCWVVFSTDNGYAYRYPKRVYLKMKSEIFFCEYPRTRLKSRKRFPAMGTFSDDVFNGYHFTLSWRMTSPNTRLSVVPFIWIRFGWKWFFSSNFATPSHTFLPARVIGPYGIAFFNRV